MQIHFSKHWIVSIGLSVFQSFGLAYGRLLAQSDSTQLLNALFIGQWALLFVLFSVLNHFLFKKVEQIQTESESFGESVNVKQFLKTGGLIFICWFPVFLAYYPTIWAYDVYAQVPVTAGYPWSLKHPLLHTIYIQGLLLIGKRLGSYEIGMVLMSLIQMLILSGVYSFCIETALTWTKKKKKWIRIGLIGLFGLAVYHSVLSVSMTKDVFFTGACCLLFVLTADEIIKQKDHTIPLILISFIVLSFRNNAIVSYIAWILLVVCFVRNKKRWLMISLCSILSFGGVQLALTARLHAQPGPIEEAYSVPMQCLTGIAVRHPELVPEYGTNQKLFGLISRDKLPEDLSAVLKPSIADPVKQQWINANELTDQGGELILTWMKMAVRYPHDTMDIWGKLELGAWFPFDTTHANIYSVYPNLQERQGYLLTDFKNIKAMHMKRPPSKLPWLESLLEKVTTDNIHQRIPVVSLFFAPATYIWIVLYLMAILFYASKWKESIPILFIVLLWGTILLGPTIVVRYMYPIMATVPFIILYSLCVLKRKPLK